MRFTNVILSITALASMAYGFPTASVQMVSRDPAPSADKLLTARAVNMSGRMTFFSPGLGACGQTSSADQAIIAISSELFGTSTTSPDCGKTVTIQANGKTATATVVDRCASCGTSDIDVSPAVFDQFASEDVGAVQVMWGFN